MAGSAFSCSTRTATSRSAAVRLRTGTRGAAVTAAAGQAAAWCAAALWSRNLGLRGVALLAQELGMGCGMARPMLSHGGGAELASEYSAAAHEPAQRAQRRVAGAGRSAPAPGRRCLSSQDLRLSLAQPAALRLIARQAGRLCRLSLAALAPQVASTAAGRSAAGPGPRLDLRPSRSSRQGWHVRSAADSATADGARLRPLAPRLTAGIPALNSV